MPPTPVNARHHPECPGAARPRMSMGVWSGVTTRGRLLGACTTVQPRRPLWTGARGDRYGGRRLHGSVCPCGGGKGRLPKLHQGDSGHGRGHPPLPRPDHLGPPGIPRRRTMLSDIMPMRWIGGDYSTALLRTSATRWGSSTCRSTPTSAWATSPRGWGRTFIPLSSRW